MLALWPFRERVDEYPGRLRDWALAITLAHPLRNHVPLKIAERLCEFSEVAYLLVEHPPLGPFTDELQRNPLFARASLALTRRLRGCQPCEQDVSALATPSPGQYLEHEGLRHRLRQLLGAANEIPPQIWPAVERVLAGPRDRGWYCAIAVQAASAPHQAAAVEHMANSVREHTNPAHALHLLSGAIAHSGSPFTGTGWGRKDLGRKLLPISRVLLARGVWPATELLQCVTPDTRDAQEYAESGDDPLWERVKDIMGEALLERARDLHQPAAARRRAIRSLGLLAPTGAGANLIRAVGKLKQDPELGEAVQFAEREQRNRFRKRSAIDGETCILDAWEYLMASDSDPAVSDPAG
jgi:hypothetical protein